MEVQPPPAPGQNQQPPPLLRCLSQLNDDVLAACLLPKLVEQGSAAAVALTCTQLCALCQRSTQHLHLSEELADADNPCHSPDVARQLVAAFPNCTSLDFAWHCSSIVGNVYRSFSPLLAGLPRLSNISITPVTGDNDGTSDSTAVDLDPVLCQLLMHATALRCLRLSLSTDWVDTDMTWASLGRLVTLTRLEVSFPWHVHHPCTQPNLRRLTGLSNLLSLTVKAPGAAWEKAEREDAALQLAAAEFPGRLTCLTELHLPLEVMHDISSVSACVHLHDLQLRQEESYQEDVPRLQPEGWSVQEWVALQQLSSLTRLHIDLSLPDSVDAAPFYGVLRHLTGLRAVGVSQWAPGSLLPLLHSLTHLTALHGAWDMDQGVPSLACPHIRELGDYWEAPFWVFPNLTSVSFFETASTSLEALCRNCTGLQRLVAPGRYYGPRVGIGGPSVCRSLAQLQHLTHLELPWLTDLELVAFTSAAAAKSKPWLRYLLVGGELSLHALMQLVSLRTLPELSVHLGAGADGSFVTEDVGSWLAGLAGMSRVSLVVRFERHRRIMEAARQWAVQHELPMPAVLQVSLGAKF